MNGCLKQKLGEDLFDLFSLESLGLRIEHDPAFQVVDQIRHVKRNIRGFQRSP